MSSLVITGAQWGDEGKGKVVDVLTERADVVARYQGGHNAGHTVVIKDEQFILHLVPSGILHKGKLAIIGNGTVVEPGSLIKELDGLIERGIEVGDNLLLSRGAHLIMPYHIALDGAGEKRRGNSKIGTTGRGIGPAYADKIARHGITVGDLEHPAIFRRKLETNLMTVNDLITKIYGGEAFEADAVYEEFMGYSERLRPFMGDASLEVNKAIDAGKKVLFEGAQGTLLDVDHGTYPYVTSSNATSGGVCTGLGIGPSRINRALGIVKAYTTRVGEGPFPTELFDDVGKSIQKKGAEFGATTGRPRRCGWLDMVALRYAMRVNGFTGIALTKIDILSGLEELKLCTAYDFEGQRLTEFPGSAAILEKCKPLYEKSMPGWKESTAGTTEYDKLPEGARDYIAAIEDMLGVGVGIVSTGQRRDEIIIRNEPF
jgi:adenylosuccinate synthase